MRTELQRAPSGILAPVRLFGTTMAPFVRRGRIVAAEVRAPIELVNAAPDEGQALDGAIRTHLGAVAEHDTPV